METIANKINAIRSKFGQQIENDILFNILFEMNRYFDRQFVDMIHGHNLKLNQNKRNLLRKYFYYGQEEILNNIGIDVFYKYHANNNDKIKVLSSFTERCEKYDENKIIKSIEERFKNIKKKETNHCKDWLEWHEKKVKSLYDFSLFVFDYSQEDFVKDDYNIENILKVIADIYNHLENYRHFIFKLEGKLYNKEKEDVTWRILYKIGIFCENFIQYKEPFFPFKQQKMIDELTSFLNSHFTNKNNKNFVEEFYSSISTGFKYEDCLVSDNQDNILLIFQKIALDKSPIPCPVCMSTNQRGNSFPELFMRSYECKNPCCAERSKSGRGKRFDEYGTYRYCKLVENKKSNSISDELISKWRRDIFSNKNNIYEMLLKYYAWDGEKICVTKRKKIHETYERKIIMYKPYGDSDYNYNFDKLPICKFLGYVSGLMKNKTGSKVIEKEINIINNDSNKAIKTLKPNQIGTVITSPPYYNAREYSQWQNMLMYFIDMMGNCKSIYNTLVQDGYYLYNIGDIVNTDNVYVKSNMSKKRLQLGFLSCLIFEKSGFNLVGNIIWDKGEVQSKRNSTMNHNSGYVKCINCYEHIFIFKKGTDKKSYSKVVKIVPVIKINSKGENIYKHTAPYPLELVDLLKPFVKKDKYILDPFLGSGTTLKWCKENKYKCIGYELNSEYYNLSKKYIGE